MTDQHEEDRREKRRYRQWQHKDWDNDFRQLIPRPEPEDWHIVRDWSGREMSRFPEVSGDLLTYYTEPWRL